MILRLIKIVCVIGLVLGLSVTGYFAWWAYKPLPMKGERVDFHITSGSGLRSIATEINAAGIELDPRFFIILAKIMKLEASMKAGSYEMGQGISPVELMKKLSRGDVTQTEVTFIEGWTFRQIRERLDAHPDLRHETRGLTDADVMARLGHVDKAPEGRFFPDTYLFAKQSRDVDVLARALRVMDAHLAREWEKRAADLPYKDPYEALIMASIVEKETGRDSDRTLVAAVFVNRLKLGMLLQTDPTVIYGLGEQFDGNLRKRDLVTDTPYNTYTRKGLPPTPIAMPGLSSLRAALHPEISPALYFVARGDGTSHFSNTLEEHNQAVNRFQRRGRK